MGSKELMDNLIEKLNRNKDIDEQTLLQFQENLSDALLEESCRQWFMFIDDTPDRADGIGFANFHREISNIKFLEYAEITAMQMGLDWETLSPEAEEQTQGIQML